MNCSSPFRRMPTTYESSSLLCVVVSIDFRVNGGGVMSFNSAIGDVVPLDDRSVRGDAVALGAGVRDRHVSPPFYRRLTRPITRVIAHGTYFFREPGSARSCRAGPDGVLVVGRGLRGEPWPPKSTEPAQAARARAAGRVPPATCLRGRVRDRAAAGVLEGLDRRGLLASTPP
jgi:hypothetical protein